MSKIAHIKQRRIPGRDYSKKLVELLPEIIGRKAKTIQQIAEEAERAEQTVGALIKKLMNPDLGKRIYIKSWQRGIHGGKITPRYLWGNLLDAPKPKPYTAAQATKRYRDSDKGRAARQRYNAKRSGVSSVISSAINKSPLMAALFR